LLSVGLGPQDVDVIELHDCFSANELITYEALGLCPEGRMFLIAAVLYERMLDDVSQQCLSAAEITVSSAVAENRRHIVYIFEILLS